MIHFRPISDFNSAVIAMRSGEMDVVYNVALNEQAEFEADPNFDTQSFDRVNVQGIAMNNQSPKLSDVRVRQAILHSLDRESINIMVAEGRYNTDTWTQMPKIGEGYDDSRITKYAFDPEKAKGLLAEAGYDESNPLTLQLKSLSNTYVQQFSTAVQASLAQSGIVVEVEEQESALWFQSLTGDRANAELVYMEIAIQEYWAPLMYWYAYDSTGFYNFNSISVPEIDAIVQDNLRQADVATREAAYADMLEMLSSQARECVIFQLNGFVATTKGLTTYHDNSHMITWLAEATWS